ncbi:hypothetical protein CBR_g37841 [Chara braunii]|uniref:F-box domain-containing protein n=1 Tax=Chara braunii TaxID=69332 RepID=A0A388LNY6_CHABU|nr:hypothetical protein CBR_g37841 [Chara braunii]|eukprot:GBG83969.1 hypothetical protein CBR_g37841 [Chara braunii]
MVFEHLADARDLVNASMVCRKWQQLANQARQHLKLQWGSLFVQERPERTLQVLLERWPYLRSVELDASWKPPTCGFNFSGESLTLVANHCRQTLQEIVLVACAEIDIASLNDLLGMCQNLRKVQLYKMDLRQTRLCHCEHVHCCRCSIDDQLWESIAQLRCLTHLSLERCRGRITAQQLGRLWAARSMQLQSLALDVTMLDADDQLPSSPDALGMPPAPPLSLPAAHSSPPRFPLTATPSSSSSSSSSSSAGLWPLNASPSPSESLGPHLGQMTTSLSPRTTGGWTGTGTGMIGQPRDSMLSSLACHNLVQRGSRTAIQTARSSLETVKWLRSDTGGDAMALMRMLQTSYHLQALHLYNCTLTRTMLCSMLRSVSGSLRHLRIDACRHHHIQPFQFIPLLPFPEVVCPRLQQLEVYGTQCVGSLVDIAAACPALTKLGITVDFLVPVLVRDPPTSNTCGFVRLLKSHRSLRELELLLNNSRAFQNWFLLPNGEVAGELTGCLTRLQVGALGWRDARLVTLARLSASSLRVLDLRDAACICDDGSSSIPVSVCRIFSVCFAKLQVLILSRFPTPCCNGAADDDVLAALGRNCPALEELTISCVTDPSRISAQGFDSLVGGCPRLSYVRICGMAEVLPAAISALGAGCKRLKRLHLAGFRFTAALLATIAMDFSELLELALFFATIQVNELVDGLRVINKGCQKLRGVTVEGFLEWKGHNPLRQLINESFPHDRNIVLRTLLTTLMV